MTKQKYEDPLTTKQRQYEQFSAQAQTASSKKQSFQNFHDQPYPASSPIRQPFENMDQQPSASQPMP